MNINRIKSIFISVYKRIDEAFSSKWVRTLYFIIFGCLLGLYYPVIHPIIKDWREPDPLDEEETYLEYLKRMESEQADFSDQQSVSLDHEIINQTLSSSAGNEPASCFKNTFKADHKIIDNLAWHDLKNTYEQLVTSSLSRETIDSLSYLLGMPIDVVRSHHFDFGSNDTIIKHKSLNFFSNDRVKEDFLSDEKTTIENMLFVRRIKNKSLGEILGSLPSNDNVFRQIYRSRGTTLGFLSFLHAEGKIKTHYDIRKILDRGYSPLLVDLWYFTKHGYSTEILRDLYDASDTDIAYIDIEKTTQTSLVSVALKAGNTEAAILWADLGSSVNPDPYLGDSLEYFKQHLRLASEDEASDWIQQFLTNPHLKDDYLTIKPDVLTSILEQKNVNKMLYLESIIQKIKASDDLIYYVQRFYYDVFNEQLSPERNCDIARLRSAMTKFFNDYERDFNRLLSEQYSETQNKISNSDSISVSTVNVEYLETLRKEKLLIEKKNWEQIDSTGQEVLTAINSVDNEAVMEGIQKAIRLAQNGQWTEALAILETLNLPNQSAMDTLIEIAYYTATDSQPILRLIQNGGKLQANAYVQLITHDRYDLIEPLRANGLNLEYSIIEGSDIIKEAVKFGSPKMLEVLLENGAFLNMDIDGLDALDTLLHTFKLSESNKEKLATLIEYGVTIEDSHRAFVHNLAENSKLEFEYIETQYPNLIPN